MSGFKNFIMRGNLVELAVAVVIGTQFSNLVKQFVSSFVNPLLSLVGGTPDFSKLVLHVGKAKFTYGTFMTEVRHNDRGNEITLIRRSARPRVAASGDQAGRRLQRPFRAAAATLIFWCPVHCVIPFPSRHLLRQCAPWSTP